MVLFKHCLSMPRLFPLERSLDQGVDKRGVSESLYSVVVQLLPVVFVVGIMMC